MEIELIALKRKRKMEMETASLFAGKGKKTDDLYELSKEERNIWCPDYDKCLWNSALMDLPLDCTSCPFKNISVRIFVLTTLEIEGCRSLLRAIFFNDIHSNYL
jgi:hypothetical protein